MLLKQHRLNCKSSAFRLEYCGIVTEPIVKSIPKFNGKKYFLVFNMFLVVLSTYIPVVLFTKLLVSLFLTHWGIILDTSFLLLNYSSLSQPQGFARFSYIPSFLILFPFSNCNQVYTYKITIALPIFCKIFKSQNLYLNTFCCCNPIKSCLTKTRTI